MAQWVKDPVLSLLRLWSIPGWGELPHATGMAKKIK